MANAKPKPDPLLAIITGVTKGIHQSPLEDTVKADLVRAVEANRNEFSKLADLLPFTAPEAFDGLYKKITDIAWKLAVPVFRQYRVPQPNARDIYRHVLGALGGTSQTPYEVDPQPLA